MFHFTAADRTPFAAPDGRHFDPLAVRRRLVLASEGRINDDLAAWGGDDDVAAAAAEERIAAAARRAFDFPADATDAVVLDTLDRYLAAMRPDDAPAEPPPATAQ